MKKIIITVVLVVMMSLAGCSALTDNGTTASTETNTTPMETSSTNVETTTQTMTDTPTTVQNLSGNASLNVTQTKNGSTYDVTVELSEASNANYVEVSHGSNTYILTSPGQSAKFLVSEGDVIEGAAVTGERSEPFFEYTVASQNTTGHPRPVN
jgi:uncharacterized protein YxeA